MTQANKHQMLMELGFKNPDADLTLLDIVEKFADLCLYMAPRDITATALWTLHTHVYDQFDHTPRLALLSPEQEWGKSQVLKFIQYLAPLPMPRLIVDTTPAGLYQAIDAGITALLIDEADNLNLSLKQNGKLRAILNAFERGAAIARGGSTKRGGAVEPKFFEPFIPIAVAAIGKLPKPLRTRCVTVHIRKKPAGIEKWRINTQDFKYMQAVAAVYQLIKHWSSNVILNQTPYLGGLGNRNADIYRPLIAIAETFGAGDRARKMALEMATEEPLHDRGTQLLIDIRAVFDRLGVDRIERQHLLNELHQFDDWGEWALAPLTKNQLLSILRDYHVPAVHPIRINGKIEQGWYRKDFEEAWRSC